MSNKRCPLNVEGRYQLNDIYSCIEANDIQKGRGAPFLFIVQLLEYLADEEYMVVSVLVKSLNLWGEHTLVHRDCR